MPCRDCIHYHDTGAAAGPAGPVDLAAIPHVSSGECRAHPPTAVMIQVAPGQGGAASIFPPVQPDAWCSEFTAADLLHI
jgi:hypothetical protein